MLDLFAPVLALHRLGRALFASRAIAPVVGANYATVSRDLASPVANATPATAPRTKTGLDGFTALLAWAAPGLNGTNVPFTALCTRAGLAILSEPDICPDRRSPRTGCTLPHQCPHP